MNKLSLSPATRPENAPFFGSWRNAYAVVVIAFVIEVALFYILGRCFA